MRFIYKTFLEEQITFLLHAYLLSFWLMITLTDSQATPRPANAHVHFDMIVWLQTPRLRLGSRTHTHFFSTFLNFVLELVLVYHLLFDSLADAMCLGSFSGFSEFFEHILILISLFRHEDTSLTYFIIKLNADSCYFPHELRIL